jgi:RND family efflux transporter MFP subunit
MNKETNGVRDSELERDIRHDSYTHPSNSNEFKPSVKPLRWIIFAVAALIVAIAAQRYIRYQQLVSQVEANEAQGKQVEVIQLHRESAASQIIVPAQIEAYHEAKLQARVNGYVDEVKVDIGDRVKKDQVLAILQTPELDAELSGAQAQLQMASAKNALSLSTDQRIKQTMAGAVAEQERDQHNIEVKVSNADLSLSNARVKQFETLSKFKMVTAPFDGVVKSRLIDVGTLVNAGGVQSTALFEIVEDSKLRVFANVPEIASTSIGDKAVIESLDGVHKVDAKVTRLAGALDVLTRTRQVEWDISNQAHEWLPGAQARVTIGTAAKAAWKVPNTAVLFKAQGPMLATVSNANVIHLIPVTVIQDEGKSLWVDGDLSDGVRVLKSFGPSISEGLNVSVGGTH